MFEVYRLSEVEVIAFGLMLIRISACIVTLPIFGISTIPVHAKVLLSLVVTMVLFPVTYNAALMPTDLVSNLFPLAIREAFLGIFLGFLARSLFFAVSIAGQILGFSMGFGNAQLFNPAFNESGSMIEQLQMTLAMLLFLGISGHHIFFEAIWKSFHLAPLGVLKFNPEALASLTKLTSEVMVIGIKLAGPMMAVILFLNVALGVVGRAVPQINIFVISFNVNMLIGLFVFMVSIPLLLHVLESDFMAMGTNLFLFLKGF